jgi:hypothetical protein
MTSKAELLAAGQALLAEIDAAELDALDEETVRLKVKRVSEIVEALRAFGALPPGEMLQVHMLMGGCSRLMSRLMGGVRVDYSFGEPRGSRRGPPGLAP